MHAVFRAFMPRTPAVRSAFHRDRQNISYPLTLRVRTSFPT
jgi:hypothetical protein